MQIAGFDLYRLKYRLTSGGGNAGSDDMMIAF